MNGTSKQHSLTARHLFSLIELLVTIAIISILASILFPALQKARIQAKSVTCLNNMKQYGVGVAQYAGDFDGRLAPHWDWAKQDLGMSGYVANTLLGVNYDNNTSTGCPNNDSQYGELLQNQTTWPDYYIRAYKPNPCGLYYTLYPSDPDRGTNLINTKSPIVSKIPGPSVALFAYELWSPYRFDIWAASADIPFINSQPGSKGRSMLYADLHVNREKIANFRDGNIRNGRLRKVK